eukprot:TRINITY_DN87291_c0_g1_i1.p1 TRINITY_DN87291_c0_g1~~TRINITY_DN87291_c0_g1_i1.p1  ORF type:complete len:247 (+),score=10.94 TRINITY_DN87291_c0_g1_i1:48-788(+)
MPDGSLRSVIPFPFIFMKSTADITNSARLLFNAQTSTFEADGASTYNGEILNYQHDLSDATSLAFKGVWHLNFHRLPLIFDLNSITTAYLNRTTAQDEHLHRLQCPGPTLTIWIEQYEGKLRLPQQLLVCMRLLSILGDSLKFNRVTSLDHPAREPIDRLSELNAARLILRTAQTLVGRIVEGNAAVVDKLGHKSLSDVPSFKIREVEHTLLLDIVSTVTDLQTVASSPALFETYKESLRATTLPS